MVAVNGTKSDSQMCLWERMRLLHMPNTCENCAIHPGTHGCHRILTACRFMLGNLCDFALEKHAVPLSAMLPVDRYMLHVLTNLAGAWIHIIALACLVASIQCLI